ncbi:hypothetical protein EXN22_13910 [Pseudomonas tructae]|uniref:Uncharacterized protein n=1 Tax=Pseudomonas tructae TaxID=2518644 RepID=A0A411MIQ7_9PSED|nr:hypothetical protein [Pseudomonas tructae]QBF26738.1 hypothetical protein EXN22_13910 [Pseudomonas tructae]
MTPGLRGYYEGTDGAVFRQIPRNVDPAQDGTKLAANHPNIFATDDGADSVSVVEFDKRMEAVIPAEVLARIQSVMRAAELLADRGLADTPPLDRKEWRRGMILSWSHARDLAVILDALGQPRPTANRHDVDELVLARHLKEKLSNADQWYIDYVTSLDDGAWINIGFFNPHLSASMYKWGDAKQGKQNAMDAHRLSAHHQGNVESPVDWIERAANFVIHHIPREHRGIRHEARGEYTQLEERLAVDPAIKNSEIGKAIARDVAAVCELLEREGKIVPWRVLKVPDNEVTPSMIEHAFLVASTASFSFEDADDSAEHLIRLEQARVLLDRVPDEILRAEASGSSNLADAYTRMLANARS